MRLALAFLTLLAILVCTGAAEAYPHFQFSSDTTTCSQCHYAPAGGGMLTGWGREEAGDTLSRGGDGAALHGLTTLPKWLSLGGDFRAAGLAKDAGKDEGGRIVFFPMQADLAARVGKGSLSFQVTAGLRGKARASAPPSGSERQEGGAGSRIVSREHYISYTGEGSDMVFRAGRFYAPYGLRVADHTSYIRRYLGFNLLQETYNLSASRLNTDSESHLSAHVSDPLLGPSSIRMGVTAMHELHSDKQALGGNLRITKSPADLQAFSGVHAKRWLAGSNLLLVAEIDAGYQSFADAPDNSRFQLAAHAGPVWFPTQGVSTSVAYELFDEDLLIKHVERHALLSWVSLMPRAHYEIMILGKAERVGPQESVLTAMMQLHYYL